MLVIVKILAGRRLLVLLAVLAVLVVFAVIIVVFAVFAVIRILCDCQCPCVSVCV